MRIKKSVIAAMIIIAACLVFESDNHYYVSASDKQGTEGTELNAYEAEELEIYLGPDWSGKEFKLETDAGIYPNAVAVDEKGLLKLEIGGSKSYKLTLMDDGKASEEKEETDKELSDGKSIIKEDLISDKETADEKNILKDGDKDKGNEVKKENIVEEAEQPPVTDVTGENDKKTDDGIEVEWVDENSVKEKTDEFTVFGIPLKHLIIFIVGMVIAIDGLIIISLIQKRRREDYEESYYDDEYGDEYEDEYYDEEYDESSDYEDEE